MRQGKGRHGLTSVYQHAIVFRRGQDPEKTDPTRTLEKTSFSGDWTAPVSAVAVGKTAIKLVSKGHRGNTVTLMAQSSSTEEQIGMFFAASVPNLYL
ncbi:hypothetical protein CNMCM8694_004165 [Aspergillus lentulus]|nr:hypothetical protein CNMCM8060_004299 [Aspergillus lentulus]KAF4196905.1 hypothetical protein CNMCM8694_004165 [Aspergillus lentulus]